jgi:ATP-dependent Clp protease protease subunit
MSGQLSHVIVPTVIESNGRTERAYDIFSLLLKNRIVFLGTPIDDQTANLVIAQLLFLNQEDPERPIRLYIQSPGGVIYSGLAIYDTMQSLPNTIETWAVGMTASFGTVLLAAGTPGHRYALPHATIHMHPAAGGTQGYTPEVEIRYKEMKRQQDMMNLILSKHTGQTVETIVQDFERDHWKNAPEAKAYGFVDEVVGSPIF